MFNILIHFPVGIKKEFDWHKCVKCQTNPTNPIGADDTALRNIEIFRIMKA